MEKSKLILQFGGGNFLRAFADWIVERMNTSIGFNAKAVVVKPTPGGNYRELEEQNGQFHVLECGLEKGKALQRLCLVRCIDHYVHPYTSFAAYLKLAEDPAFQFMISNTTEAGIAYSPEAFSTTRVAQSFPAKLCQWLHHRYQHFAGAPEAGLIHLPCELIPDNGLELKRYILQYADDWGLSEGFRNWVETANVFCNTLVDRIVPGHPQQIPEELRQKMAFRDKLLVKAEPYHLWAIQGPAELAHRFPAARAGLNVHFPNELDSWRRRKVRILNGAHTSMVPTGLLYEASTVREAMEDEHLGSFLRRTVLEEIIPSMGGEEEQLQEYATTVFERFRNPCIHHELGDIALNSIPKFKSRILPSLLEYFDKKGQIPARLAFAFTALLCLYKGQWEGKPFPANDAREHIDFVRNCWQEAPDWTALAAKACSYPFFQPLPSSFQQAWTEKTAHWLEELRKSPMATIVEGLS